MNRRTHAAVTLALGATLAAPLAFCQSNDAPEAPRQGWSPSSRVSVGSRLVVRYGAYELAGFGGQVALRPAPWLSVELFTDHLVGTRDGALRHDHEVGGTARFHVLRGERWAVFPMVGACANLAVMHAAQAPDASVNDIQFGLRAGVGVEFALRHGFSVGAEVLALGYLGHALRGWEYRAEVAEDLSLVAMGQAVFHASYHL